MADRILRYQGEYDSSIPNVSIAEFTLTAMKSYGDDEACMNVETRQSYTYAEIVRQTEALAAGMQAKFNLAPRDRVAVVLPLCLEYPVTTIAVQLAGATAVLINPAQTIGELKNAVRLTSPVKLWVGDASFLTKFEQLYADQSTRPPFIVHDGPSWSQVISAGKGKAVRMPSINAMEDVAFIFFSSGTTGLPKGVMITHANCIAARKMNRVLNATLTRTPELVALMMLPPYHTAGYTGMIEALALGVRYVLLPTFTFRKMLQAVQDFKVSVMVVAPPIALELAKQPVEKEFDLSSLMVLRSGSGAVSKETIQTLQDKFGLMYFQSYGMTESTMVTHANSIGYNKEGSVGIVLPFCEAKVVDMESSEALGPNKEGEICVRGPLVMKGYIGNEEATRNTIDKDGWLHSGDIGYYDDEGFFFITDRLKELIKYNGFQVPPTELEQILLTHPDVVDAAVAPVPDESAGELPRAYVVRRSGSKVTESELEKLVSEQVSPYKRLRGGVVFIDTIPKNPTGKILRRELKKLSSKL